MPKQNARQVDLELDIGRLAEFLGYWLRKAQVAFYENFLRGAPAAGLTPGQFAILVLIDRNPNLSQNRLSEGLRLDKSTLAVTLHRLSDRGLIRRVRSTEDRRENALRLTAKGKATLKGMLEHVSRHERHMMTRLSAAERRALVSLLQKLV
jgi:DNA-binding MarR family transcriptional regulator